MVWLRLVLALVGLAMGVAGFRRIWRGLSDETWDGRVAADGVLLMLLGCLVSFGSK